jgi:hypothetical protein
MCSELFVWARQGSLIKVCDLSMVIGITPGPSEICFAFMANNMPTISLIFVKTYSTK